MSKDMFAGSHYEVWANWPIGGNRMEGKLVHRARTLEDAIRAYDEARVQYGTVRIERHTTYIDVMKATAPVKDVDGNE